MSENKFYILVDYDNLEKNQKFEDQDCITAMQYMINRLDQNSDFFKSANNLQRVDVRLYGGWYREKTWTPKSQRIHRNITVADPLLFSSCHGIQINVFIQLSFGIFSMPGRAFWGTVRRYPAKYRVANKYKCCNDGGSCIDFIKHLNENQKCIYCGTDQSDLLFCDSQKMVDTMICCDLLYLSQQPGNLVTVVSSDDDLLPPIFQQCLVTNNIYHVLTRDIPGKFFDEYYKQLCPANYKKITWE